MTSGVTRAVVPAVVPSSSSDGFDWADAGIGAAGTLAVLLAALGGARAATHRRNRDEPAGPSALAH